MTDESAEKKIIIDEDWKSRVEAEREADREEKAAAQSESAQSGDATGGADRQFAGPMPDASLEMLLTTLAAEAMVALGQVANPITGQADVNLDQAKYFIDTLQILRDKTKGNLTDEEESAMQVLIGQLQMAFVGVKNQPPTATTEKATEKSTPDIQT